MDAGRGGRPGGSSAWSWASRTICWSRSRVPSTVLGTVDSSATWAGSRFSSARGVGLLQRRVTGGARRVELLTQPADVLVDPGTVVTPSDHSEGDVVELNGHVRGAPGDGGGRGWRSAGSRPGRVGGFELGDGTHERAQSESRPHPNRVTATWPNATRRHGASAASPVETIHATTPQGTSRGSEVGRARSRRRSGSRPSGSGAPVAVNRTVRPSDHRMTTRSPGTRRPGSRARRAPPSSPAPGPGVPARPHPRTAPGRGPPWRVHRPRPRHHAGRHPRRTTPTPDDAVRTSARPRPPSSP